MDEFTKFISLTCHEPQHFVFISLTCHESQHFVLENPHSLVVNVVGFTTYLQTPNNPYLVTNHLVLLTTR